MGIFDAFSGEAGEDAAAANRNLYGDFRNNAFSHLGGGYSTARGDLSKSIGAYGPMQALGNMYGRGVNAYQGALGLNGQAGSDAARAMFQSNPGYDYEMKQGEQSVLRNNNAVGGGNSGDTLMDLTAYSQNLAQKNWGSWLDRLGGFVNPQLQAIGGAAQGMSQGYGNQAQLAWGDALSKVGVEKDFTGGMTAANNAEAQAKVQGASNMFGLGTQLLGLGSKFLPKMG